jgi:hypothetical protein
MKKGQKKKILKAKLLNYITAFAEDLNKVHPDTKAKFRIEDEEYLLDDYLNTFVEDINDIKEAYDTDDNGETLERLWNGSYNYGIEED